MNLCMSDFRKQIRRQILGDLIDEGKTGREARAIPHANRKQRREVRFYLNGKIEYDAMTGQTETDRGRRQQNRWPVPRGAKHGRPVGLDQGAVL
jgi:hypothetical protein